MAVVGITGGIACGKSTFRDLLASVSCAAVFDADAAARRYLMGDPSVHSTLREAWGAEVFASDGTPDRAKIRSRVFADSSAKAFLEGLLHPLVRAEWMSLADRARAEGGSLLVDIPLLFETSAPLPLVVTVAASPSVQHARLAARGLGPELAASIVASQLPLEEKIRKSRWVVWNDGSIKALADQATILADRLAQLPPHT